MKCHVARRLRVLLPIAWTLGIGLVHGIPMWEKIEDPLISDLTVLSLTHASSHPSFPDGILVAGTRQNGVIISEDGVTWTHAGLDSTSIATMAISSVDGTIYAGEGDGGVIGIGGFTGQGIYRSDDASNWTVVTNGMLNPTERVAAIAVNSLGDVFTSINGRFHATTDRGENWTNIDDPQIEFVSAIAVGEDDNLIVGSYGLVTGYLSVLSRDGTSILHQFMLPQAFDRPSALLVDPYRNKVYAGLTVSLNKPINFHASSDTGASWGQSASIGEPGVVEPEGLSYPWIAEIVARPFGDVIALVNRTMEDPIHRSADGGVTWELKSEGIENNIVLAATVTGDGTVYVGTEGNGIYKSTYALPTELSHFSAE